MLIKVNEASGPALDRMVAKALGYTTSDLDLLYDFKSYDKFQPSTDWAQGGPIIEREKIDTAYENNQWFAYESLGDCCDPSVGNTPLIAAMRCYVASKLGGEVDMPDELSTN